MASRKDHKSKIVINTQRLDKNISNRRSHEKNLTPKQIVNKIHKEIRGNSQPPANQDYLGGVTTNYEQKNASVKETQEMQRQRQMLIQQYTQNQHPRNISAFNQQITIPINNQNADHNFMMNQTAHEFSPNKKANSHRRQIALSPKPTVEKSFSYYKNEITEMDQPSNYKTQDNGTKSQRQEIQQYDDGQKMRKGATRTILTSLGVEQQPVQISKKIQENANKNLINENLFQAQLNGQIKVTHDIQGVRNQVNYHSAKEQKKQQNFFKSNTGQNSEMKSPMREQSFLPSIDNSYRANVNSMPPEVKIPQIYPGTPGKSHLKQGFNLKIGENAEVKITINNSQTPRPQKQSSGGEKTKKVKKESSSQNAHQKQVAVNHQKQSSDPLRANKDRQLEDLNETLQRLAREKQNAINGRINLTTSRRKPNKMELIQDARTPGYRLEVSDPYFMDEDAQEKLRLKKKHQQAEQDLQNFKYKLETNNRVQPGGRLIMGDNMLTSQRLQGIKQVNIQPKSSSNTEKQKQQNLQQQYQTPQPHKIYKINKQDIQMENEHYLQTPNGQLFQQQQIQQQQYQMQLEEQKNQNIKNIKERGVRNIIVESQMQIPTFGPDQASLQSRQSSPLLNSPAVELDDRIRKSINYESESNNNYPKMQTNQKRSQEIKQRPEKSLKIGCRFSSVLEDVEKEQIQSPSPLNKLKNKDLQIQINQNLKTESNFNKKSKQSNLEMILIGEIPRKDLIKQIDPDMDTLSRQDLLMDSRDDLIEIKGEKDRSNINISDLEMTPATPENNKNRSFKKNQNQAETTYSQVFNLQNTNKLEHQQIKPSDTIDKKTLQNALKPPLQQKEHNSRYNVNQTNNSVSRRKQSNTELDVKKPQTNSTMNLNKKQKQTIQNGKTIEVSARETSIQSNGSGQDLRQRRMLQAQRTQQITTPRGKLAVSLGNGMNNDPTQSISPSQKNNYSSPQSKNEKRQPSKEKKQVTKMASQYIDMKNPENTYLPQIESRQNSKSPMRQIQKPPMPSKNERIDSLNLTKTKFGGNKQNQKSNKRREDFKKPHKTQFETITQKIDIVPGDSSSDCNENMRALVIGKPFKLKKDHQSFCQEYCQYRGQQIPKKYKSIFTPNKYRKVEGGFVLSQRLFLSNECAESEDRRMMPILVINLDGAMGYWDDYNKFHYVLRPKIIDSLIQLSYDFRLIAVSSKKQKYMFRLIYGLMNLNEDQHTKHLYFDAVYQLGSSTDEKNEMCTIKNIEETQFDLTQVLLDMQFKRQIFQKKTLETIQTDGKNEFLTFWESKLYRPHNKMIIFTTERYLNKNHCYSFDYNYLYQATKFQRNESSKKSPIVIQMPHLRCNPKISFEIIHQLLFALQNITQAVSCENQDRSKIVDGKYYENPEVSSFQVCKKFLSFKWNVLEKKMRNNGSVKGLRVFDSNNDPYVNLGNIDFNESYKFIKKYFANRKNNWLKVHKYYLNTKQSKFEKIHKIKLMAKVTFNDSPEIIRMGEENGSQKIAIGTTHDSSKAESNHQTRANQYMSDDAKNLYNGLMIRNFKMQQEINAYARHHRILFQHKMAKQKQDERQIEALLRPIVIFDGEEDDEENPKSGMRKYGKLKSSINHDNKEKIAEQLSLLSQSKKYAFKFRTLQIRSGEFYEQWNTQDCDLSKFTVIDLKQKVTQESFERKGENNQQTERGGKGDGNPKSNLIEYLSKKQGRIAYTTSQETHLKNNLSQLVDGKQQYVDQQKELQEQDKEQLPSINDKEANSNLHQNYLDLI